MSRNPKALEFLEVYREKVRGQRKRGTYVALRENSELAEALRDIRKHERSNLAVLSACVEFLQREGFEFPRPRDSTIDRTPEQEFERRRRWVSDWFSWDDSMRRKEKKAAGIADPEDQPRRRKKRKPDAPPPQASRAIPIATPQAQTVPGETEAERRHREAEQKRLAQIAGVVGIRLQPK